jgi:hypothetical protein
VVGKLEETLALAASGFASHHFTSRARLQDFHPVVQVKAVKQRALWKEVILPHE